MKVSAQWMEEILGQTLCVDTVSDRLTMAGLEVESVEPVAVDFDRVVVGEVLERAAHPNADRLSVCQVSLGDGDSVQIVCGASNVRQGLKVPVIQVGGHLPGLKIKRSKLRGVESCGMICSASELGLAEESEGILELPSDAPVGHDFRDYMKLNDRVIDVAITPNRGDCLSMHGIVREWRALHKMQWERPVVESTPVSSDCQVAVASLSEQACPRYVGRLIEGIDPSVSTPDWVLEGLRRAGIRGSSLLVVDLINWVMLEMGQPMHAFDASTLTGSIAVREAKSGESLVLLDGKSIALQPGSIVIADESGPLALAGVMGGQHSAITEKTTNLFLESAYFDPSIVSHSAKAYGVSSDSSYRYERGVDFTVQQAALERLTQLIVTHAGGAVGPLVEARSLSHLPSRSPITLRMPSLARYLDEPPSPADVLQLLSALGFDVSVDEAGDCVAVPPAYRFDIEQEVDLIEEVIRLIGYDSIPSVPLKGELRLPNDAGSSDQAHLDLAKSTLVNLGYQEAITYSFVEPNAELAFSEEKTKALTLVNPLARDMSVMRRSLWPGLMQALRQNQNRQHHRIALFEHGMCFFPGESIDSARQERRLSGLWTGPLNLPQWGESVRLVDYYDIKQHVVHLLSALGIIPEWAESSHPALHPHQQQALVFDGVNIGVIGALHPGLLDGWGISQPVYAFELNWLVLKPQPVKKYVPFSRFPTMKRDLSLVADEGLSVSEICDQVTSSAGPLLNAVDIFDIYRNERIGERKKSVTLSLVFQASDRTLIDEEVESVMQDVMRDLKGRLGVFLRE